MKSVNPNCRSRWYPGGGFTLVDLLAILGTLAVGALLLAPALARTQPNSRLLQCLNNQRQLVRAWQIYADDYAGSLVMAYSGGSVVGGNAASDPYAAPWALGWQDWTTGSDNTNTLFVADDKYSKLARYLGHDRNVIKCPADQYLSPAQRAAGWKGRLRSVSINVGVGDGNAEVGPWDASYRHMRTTADFLFPAPAETWVFLDEHPDSINDPTFYNPNRWAWMDLPATYHNGAAGFSFADGHTEMHRWTGSLKTNLSFQAVGYLDLASGLAVPTNDSDVKWMNYHGGRMTAATF